LTSGHDRGGGSTSQSSQCQCCIRGGRSAQRQLIEGIANTIVQLFRFNASGLMRSSLLMHSEMQQETAGKKSNLGEEFLARRQA
jgi:hypothetical protein